MSRVKVRPARRWVTFDVPWLPDDEHRDLLNRLCALFPGSGAGRGAIVVGLDHRADVEAALIALVDDGDDSALIAVIVDRLAELYPRVDTLAIRSLYPRAWLAEDPRTARHVLVAGGTQAGGKQAPLPWSRFVGGHPRWTPSPLTSSA